MYGPVLSSEQVEQAIDELWALRRKAFQAFAVRVGFSAVEVADFEHFVVKAAFSPRENKTSEAPELTTALHEEKRCLRPALYRSLPGTGRSMVSVAGNGYRSYALGRMAFADRQFERHQRAGTFRYIAAAGFGPGFLQGSHQRICTAGTGALAKAGNSAWAKLFRAPRHCPGLRAALSG